MMKNKYFKIIFTLASLALISVFFQNCSAGGGGGDGDDDGGGSITLSGTAATGAPMNGAAITIKDSAGVTRTGTTTATGSYNIDVVGLTPPYLVRVVSSDELKTLYSVGTAAGVINVHPLTDMIIRTWYEVQSTTVAAAFASVTANPPPDALALGVIKQVVENLVAQFLGLMGVDAANFDLITTPFTANSTGFDGFLDNISVNTGSGVISINTSGTSGVGTLPEYQVTINVGNGGVLTSTIAENLDNIGNFTTVSTVSNTISAGITTSPYAGTWQALGTVTDVMELCGADSVNTTLTVLFTVDANGNFVIMDQEYPGYIAMTGNIAANGMFTVVAFGDTLVSSGSCPLGTGSGSMSSTSSGAGTLSQGNGALNLALTRITASPYAGTWTFSHTPLVINNSACEPEGTQVNVAQTHGLMVIDPVGNFQSTTFGIVGKVTNAGSATFSIGGACSGTASTTSFSANAISGTYTQGSGANGTWTLTR